MTDDLIQILWKWSGTGEESPSGDVTDDRLPHKSVEMLPRGPKPCHHTSVSSKMDVRIAVGRHIDDPESAFLGRQPIWYTIIQRIQHEGNGKDGAR